MIPRSAAFLDKIMRQTNSGLSALAIKPYPLYRREPLGSWRQRPRGGMGTQRAANPSIPVRFRARPPPPFLSVDFIRLLSPNPPTFFNHRKSGRLLYDYCSSRSFLTS